jgi:hypothetical protein
MMPQRPQRGNQRTDRTSIIGATEGVLPELNRTRRGVALVNPESHATARATASLFDDDAEQPLLGTSTNVAKGFALVNTITDCVLLSDWTWSAREFLTEDDEIIVFASVVKARRVMRRYPGAEVMPV